MQNKCKSCVLLDKQNSICRINNMKVDPEADYCSFHKKEAHICEACGSISLADTTFYTDEKGKVHTLCRNCQNILSICNSCKEAKYCALREDESCQLPLTVRVQVQQGPFVQIKDIINPDRIKATCMIHCKCYREDLGCLRWYHGAGCNDWVPFWD